MGQVGKSDVGVVGGGAKRSEAPQVAKRRLGVVSDSALCVPCGAERSVAERSEAYVAERSVRSGAKRSEA